MSASDHVRRATALNDIADERRRQIEDEDWTPEHDDEHDNGALALAAVCYAAPLSFRTRKAPTKSYFNGRAQAGDAEWSYSTEQTVVPEFWPWDGQHWKPKDQRRNLIKAAALIVAEIERLDRQAAGS